MTHREGAIRVKQNRGEPCILAKLEARLDKSPKARRRRERFEASARPAIAPRPLRIDGHMAEFPGHPADAVHHPPTNDQPAAYSRTESEQYDVGVPRASPRKYSPI